MNPAIQFSSFFNLVSFCLATVSVIKLLENQVTLTSCLVAVSFFVLCTVLSKFGKLDKASVDFDDKKIELDGVDEVGETKL